MTGPPAVPIRPDPAALQRAEGPLGALRDAAGALGGGAGPEELPARLDAWDRQHAARQAAGVAAYGDGGRDGFRRVPAVLGEQERP
ncbi:MAG: hypothetical protein KQH83_12755 [Actinobacteria bacterium]|nr:hypothetical protein [Actinomycetota bacterium]